MKNKNFHFVVLLLCLGLLSSCHSKKKNIPPPNPEPLSSQSWQEVRTYPLDYGRTDDLFFFNPERGFVINSEGYLLLTEDSGQTWKTNSAEKKPSFAALPFVIL